MKTAVIYARYSSERQTEQSIEGQIRDCNEYAQRNDIMIVDTYIDRAMTGTNDNRPNFQRMLKDSYKKAWDIVLVYKLDRFSRDKYETAMHRHTLKTNGIKLVSAKENIPDTPEGIILESLLEGMNQYYSAELSQKVKRGMRESRAKGNFTGGNLIYGYKVVDKKVQIDEDKAKVVRYIYEEYAKGTIVKEIIRHLTEQGILNKGKPFAKNTVYHILQNEKYSGIYHHNGEEFTNIYPRIVPDEYFSLVKKRNDENHYGKRSTETVYLLRNKIICGYCGSTISAETGTARNGEILRYYKCLGKKRGNNCKKTQHKKAELEELIINTVNQVFLDKNNLSEIVDKVMHNHQQRIKEQSILNILIAEQKQLEKEINNFLEAIGQGIITSSTKRRLNELEERKEEVDAKIAIEESRNKISISKQEIEKYIKKALKENPKVMLDMLIKQIILYDDKMEITFNYTESKSPDDNNQGSLFYTIETTISNNLANSPCQKSIAFMIDIYV